MSHLISVDSQIQEAFMNNQHVIAVSLDIEKAYDMVWKRRILKILQIIGIKGNMYDFIKNFSLDRKLQVRINGQLSDIKQIENGVPQGSVLSVTLFLLSINDIDKGVQPPVIIRKYADDITVLCKGKSVPSTQKTMQKALNTIFEWSLSTGFKFSAKKTECMFFSKRIDTVSPKLQLGTQPLRFVNKMKILGLQFDPKLTWKIHIQELIMECKKRLNVIKCLSNNNWGADKNLLLLTYKAIIRSKIDYGSLLYQSANKKELRKIESIHNKGLRICTGCFHTTPIGSILIEAQETSLNHRRKTLNLKYAAKAASSTNPIIHNDIFPQLQNIYNSHFRYKPMYSRITQQLKELNIKSISAEKHRQFQIPPWTIEKMTLELSLTDYNNSNLTKEDWNTQFKEVIQKYKNYSHFYISNKNSEQDTEAIVYTPNEKFSFLLHHYCSSNSTESYALMTALKMIYQSLDSNIIVFTNSLSTIKLCSNKTSNSEMAVKIQELHHLIQRLGKKLVIFWIPPLLDIPLAAPGSQIPTSLVDLRSVKNVHNIAHTTNDIWKYLYGKMKTKWSEDWKIYKASSIHKKIKNFYNLQTSKKIVPQRSSYNHQN